MANVKVNTAQLRQTATNLVQLKNRLKSEDANMRSNQRTLTAQWDGPANSVFDQAFNRNITEFEAFADLIQRYANALNDYANNYERVENTNKGIASTR